MKVITRPRHPAPCTRPPIAPVDHGPVNPRLMSRMLMRGTHHPITFDAVGAGTTTSIGAFTTSGSVTETHVVGTGVNRHIFAAMTFTGPASATGAVTTMKYGGVSLTSLGKVFNNSSQNFIEVFHLANPTSGSASMVGTLASIPSNFSAAQVVLGSVSYANVLSLGTAVTAGSSTTTANAVAATAPVGGMTVYFHMKQVTSAFTAYSQTSRFTVGQSSFNRLLIGDAVGTGASVTSTATQASAATWSAVAVPMTGS